MRLRISSGIVEATTLIALTEALEGVRISFPLGRHAPESHLLLCPDPLRGKLVLLQCLAAYPLPGTPEYRWPVDQSRLERDCGHPELAKRCFYVLPEPPARHSSAPAPLVMPWNWRHDPDSAPTMRVIAAPALLDVLGEPGSGPLTSTSLAKLSPPVLAGFLGELSAPEHGETWLESSDPEERHSWFGCGGEDELPTAIPLTVLIPDSAGRRRVPPDPRSRVTPPD